jgi:hypothetical protein
MSPLEHPSFPPPSPPFFIESPFVPITATTLSPPIVAAAAAAAVAVVFTAVVRFAVFTSFVLFVRRPRKNYQGYISSACNTCTGFGNAVDALNKVPFYTGPDIPTVDRNALNTCNSCSAGTGTCVHTPHTDIRTHTHTRTHAHTHVATCSVRRVSLEMAAVREKQY